VVSWFTGWLRRNEFAVVFYLCMAIVAMVVWQWVSRSSPRPPAQICETKEAARTEAKEVAQALGSARGWEQEAAKTQARYEEAVSRLKTCRDDLEHELRIKALRRQVHDDGDDLVDQQVPVQDLLKEKKR